MGGGGAARKRGGGQEGGSVTMMYWFTADEHYGHERIIEYCGRPFDSVKKMDETIRGNLMSRIENNDVVVHAGDFALVSGKKELSRYITWRKGRHIYLKGSHDYWTQSNLTQIWERQIEGIYVVVCHYPMLRWARSHYNSWQLFGHCHGKLVLNSKQYDVGVDNNNFYPVSFDQVRGIMESKPDNPNLIVKKGE